MTEQPRAVLGRILNDLGSTLIEVVAGQADPARTVSGVLIQDPLDDADCARICLPRSWRAARTRRRPPYGWDCPRSPPAYWRSR
ncbi:hypothetical protein ACFVRD_24910 [Streptomyces sp. NPDC057908]|uniref:hypothetical protein n=1 Tax=unclassified Streptomyces TaxID=2593676 RepID=UPI002E13D7D7|nr:hypothetical protein OG609_02765 [Streptomyces sp. NBC_01224]